MTSDIETRLDRERQAAEEEFQAAIDKFAHNPHARPGRMIAMLMQHGEDKSEWKARALKAEGELREIRKTFEALSEKV